MNLLLLALSAQAGTITLTPGDEIEAKTRELGPGDTIVLEGGVYEVERTLVWTAPGTADQPVLIEGKVGGTEVVIRSKGSGAVAVLRDSSFVTVRNIAFEGGEGWEEARQVGFRIANSTDVSFQSNRIRRMQLTGLDIDGNTRNITVLHNRIHDLVDGNGILVGCSDASCWLQDGLIAENLIHDLGGDYVTGIRLEHGTQNVEVRDNVLFRIGTADGTDGIFAGSTESGPPNLIHGNAIWDVYDDGIWIEGSAVVRNNVVHLTGGVGIGTRNTDRNGLSNVVISHNTVVFTGDWSVWLQDWFHQDGMVFANNAVANPIGRGLRYLGQWDEGDASTNHITNNHVTGWVDGLDEELFPHAVVPGAGLADFMDPDGLDFYPVQHSDLVNGGDSSGASWVPEVDFNGTRRQGDAPDVGAYEWNGAGNPGWPLQEGFKELEVDERGSTALSRGCCNKKDQPSEAVLVLPLALLWAGRRRRRA